MKFTALVSAIFLAVSVSAAAIDTTAVPRSIDAVQNCDDRCRSHLEDCLSRIDRHDSSAHRDRHREERCQRDFGMHDILPVASARLTEFFAVDSCDDDCRHHHHHD